MTMPAITDLLPHAPPMVLLDNVLSCDDEWVCATATITAHHPFATPQGVAVHVGIELMAQVCGVYVGKQSLKHGHKPQIGYLLGTRNFHAIQEWFSLDSRLVIDAIMIFREEQMGVFDCKITHNEILIASAQLSLFQPEHETKP